MNNERLRIHEIYRSIQGEGLAAGLPCSFVRLTGCDLRCVWCDTEEAFDGGTWWSCEQILEEIERLGADVVQITGGEPLLQPGVHGLIRRLADRGATVLLETGGHRSLADVDPRTCIVMDVKCPDSGECEHNDWRNLAHLKPTDQIKAVIASPRDYAWARQQVRERSLAATCHVVFSPVHGALEPRVLAEWILADRLPVRLGLQLHKIIWSPEARGV